MPLGQAHTRQRISDIKNKLGPQSTMTDTITIYHNPRCSKSRQTLEMIEMHDFDIEVVRYLENPPSTEQLDLVLQMLNIEPRQLMRRKEPPYSALNLADESLSRKALIKAMVENPILIERPIVVRGNQARLGRPPETVLDLLK